MQWSVDRRQFIQRATLAIVAAWSAGLGKIRAAVGQKTQVAARKDVSLKPVSVEGFKLPARKPRTRGNPCEADTCTQAGDVNITCNLACDGCDNCDSGCNTCNGCNGCDASCDPGCNTCNKCNGCDTCNACNGNCNTCNQCDFGQDVCVISCDSSCDGCNSGNTQCGIDIDKNGISDAQQIKSLERSISAFELSLKRKKAALAKLRTLQRKAK
jgi:hypothetical protein